MSGFIAGMFFILSFLTSVVMFSTFLFYGISQAATHADEKPFTPASYQPMVMLTRRARPAVEAPVAPPAAASAAAPVAVPLAA